MAPKRWKCSVKGKADMSRLKVMATAFGWILKGVCSLVFLDAEDLKQELTVISSGESEPKPWQETCLGGVSVQPGG